MQKNVLSILIIVLIGILALPNISSAISVTTGTTYSLINELGVETNPTYPKPNENVTISLTMYTEDLNSSKIEWYQNDKLVLQGQGETQYSFKIGAAGEETKIKIVVTLASGTSFSKSFTLNPTDVEIVWEADSYVPPFYKGKALHPKQGVLKLVAIPQFVSNGKKIAPENLIYKWSNDYSVYQDQSGYGKNVITINGSLLGKNESINVLVTDPSSNMSAEGFVDIPTVNPEIVFYENSPYYGYLFDSAITNIFNLKSEEVQILAAPFFFTNETDSILNYVWQLNNQILPDLSNSRTAIFKKPEESGQSKISLEVTNENKILQQADTNLIMNFTNEEE